MKLVPLVVLLAAGTFGGAVWAGDLPNGGVVAVGAASVTAGANSLVINQSSNRAVINWNSFSVGAGNTVQFVQPGARSAVLNRVVAANPSMIYGSVTANGQVFLVNPNGIFVGPGGTIHAAGIFLSTGDIANGDFVAGSIRFEPPPASSAVVVRGGELIATDRIEIGSDRINIASATLDATNAIEFSATGMLNIADVQFHTNSLRLDPAEIHIALPSPMASLPPLLQTPSVTAALTTNLVFSPASLPFVAPPTVTTAGGNLTVGGGSITIAGSSGSLSLTTGGTPPLSGAAAPTGIVTIGGGNITLGGGGTVASGNPVGGPLAPAGGSISLGGAPSIAPSASNQPLATAPTPAPSRPSPAAVRLATTGGLVDGAVTVRMSLVDSSPITLR